jgi:hypothetical protein
MIGSGIGAIRWSAMTIASAWVKLECKEPDLESPIITTKDKDVTDMHFFSPGINSENLPFRCLFL